MKFCFLTDDFFELYKDCEEIEKKKAYMMELQANIEVFMEQAGIKNMVIDGIEVSRNDSTEK